MCEADPIHQTSNKTETDSSISGQVCVFEANALTKLPIANINVLYDKDAFGAILVEQRAPYVERMSSYLADDCLVLLAGASRYTDVDGGPPFNLSEELVKEFWSDFEIVDKQTEQYNPKANERGFCDVTYILKRRKANK